MTGLPWAEQQLESPEGKYYGNHRPALESQLCHRHLVLAFSLHPFCSLLFLLLRNTSSCHSMSRVPSKTQI